MEVSEGAVLRLLTALRECSRHVERGVAEHPLDETDVGLLAMAKATSGQLRPSQAAAALGVAFPSVTRHVRALQAAGHLAVVPDPGDRRGYRITLTEAGDEHLHDFQRGLVARFAPVLAGLDAAEVDALADGMTKLASAMTSRLDEQRQDRTAWWRATPAT